MINWDEIRKRFPVTDRLAYLNSAAAGPVSRASQAAAAGWSPGTKGKVTGEVVILKVEKKEDLAQYKGKLKNAVILLYPPRAVKPSDSARARS